VCQDLGCDGVIRNQQKLEWGRDGPTASYLEDGGDDDRFASTVK
jgi:hypothetical protein